MLATQMQRKRMKGDLGSYVLDASCTHNSQILTVLQFRSTISIYHIWYKYRSTTYTICGADTVLSLWENIRVIVEIRR